MSQFDNFFLTGRIGYLDIPNRLVMAPLGRARNDPATRAPGELSQIYYAQRAGAGLIISEATHVSAGSVSRAGTGAIHTAEQVFAWQQVTRAVHDAGGRIFQQLFHLGRKADPDLRPDRSVPVAPSAIAAQGSVALAGGGQKPWPTPRSASLDEIAQWREEFALAARNAREAGFDGIELHAANGFLIEQFLRDDANHREDNYGGSIENRARFLLEVVDDAVAVFGAGGVGVRISPHFAVDGPGTSDAAALYAHVARELTLRNIAYLHVIEPDAIPEDRKVAPALRQIFAGPFILAGEFNRESAAQALAQGRADFIAFGRLYIANPDLAARFARKELRLNIPDEATFYAGGADGYIDYPALHDVLAAAQ